MHRSSRGALPLPGEDWFPLDDERAMTWRAIATLLEQRQTDLVAPTASPARSGKTTDDQMDLVLAITCHAVCHAGQIQFIKVLAAA